MKLDVRALALTMGLLWAFAVLFVASIATFLGPVDGSMYGKEFLLLTASIYPGFDAAPGFGNALVGAAYGFADGLIGGAVFGWLYNRLAR